MLPAKKIESNYFSHVPKNEWRKNRMEEKKQTKRKESKSNITRKSNSNWFWNQIDWKSSKWNCFTETRKSVKRNANISEVTAIAPLDFIFHISLSHLSKWHYFSVFPLLICFAAPFYANLRTVTLDNYQSRNWVVPVKILTLNHYRVYQQELQF